MEKKLATKKETIIAKLRKYLRTPERQDFLYMKYSAARFKDIYDRWKTNLTKDEAKNLKTAATLINKVADSIYFRQDNDSMATLNKMSTKYDFRIFDDYTTQKLIKEIKEGEKQVVLDKDYMDDISEGIMECFCKDCNRDREGCALHKFFMDTVAIEPMYGLNNEQPENCPYSYTHYDGHEHVKFRMGGKP